MQQDGRQQDALRSGIALYKFSKTYLCNMKYEQGELTEADINARRRFWNKRGFFGEPKKKEIERSSRKMQKLIAAIKDCTREVLYYALQIAPKTFKVNQSNNI